MAVITIYRCIEYPSLVQGTFQWVLGQTVTLAHQARETFASIAGVHRHDPHATRRRTHSAKSPCMCGIAGLVDLKRRYGPDELRSIASRMADSLSHRGPDDHGVWIDAEAGVAPGHTRLSIIDLSPAGAQPMVSSCGRFVLSYNGEVYNAPELRAELEAAGRQFRGHSDTEVMVEGFAVWGVRPTVERLIGMFAFAAWDRTTRTLMLARDRLGIKPLYWGRRRWQVSSSPRN